MFRNPKYSILFVSWFLALNYNYSQEITNRSLPEVSERYSIKWVKNIPPANDKDQKKGFLNRLLFGAKDINSFKKPVDIIGINNDECLILDQGYGSVFETKDGRIRRPRIFKKPEYLFPSLVSACLLPSNELLFTDSKLNKVLVLSSNKKNIRSLNDELILNRPTGIGYSSLMKQLWVVETGAHQITILDLNGDFVKNIGKRGVKESEFNYPTSIWIDSMGYAYVVDALNYRVQIFDPNGNFVNLFGENGDGSGNIARPKGIATDSYGHIYVVDALFHRIQIFDSSGEFLYQFGKQGRDKEQFWMPLGIYIDKLDNIYIADGYNSRIQIFKIVKN